MLSALGVVLLYVGAFIEVVDISMAVIASLLCVVAVIEYGKGAPWTVFAVTAILSLLLLPNKSPALMYTLFFGYYPILKERFERLKKGISWLCKELVFNVALVLIFAASKYLLAESADFQIGLDIIGAVLSEDLFILYDIALTRLISFYIYKLRNRLGFK